MLSIKGWPKGMDNIHQPNELGGDTLSRAVNVDVLDSGKLRMRRGHQLTLAATNGHSLWDDGRGNALYVEGNQLKKFNGSSGIVLGTVNTGLNRLAYVEINADVYFSAPGIRGRIRDGVMGPWGVELPASAPEIATTTGQLDAGIYFAAVTYVLDDGRESGASGIARIELNAVGGISTTALPIPTDPSISKKRLYLSTANGEMLYLAQELTGSTQFASIKTPPSGPELRTMFMSPPPYSMALTQSNGRCFMVDAGNPRIVWFTEPNDYDHVDLRSNFYQFPEPVTVIAGTRTGLYVCADQTYYIGNAGVADQHSQVVVFEHGGIAETMKIIPSTKEPIWMSERGAVVGHEGGQAQILAYGRLAPGALTSAAAMVREQDGLRQFVVVGQGESSAMQAGSYAEAEIIRRT